MKPGIIGMIILSVALFLLALSTFGSSCCEKPSVMTMADVVKLFATIAGPAWVGYMLGRSDDE